jgi:hypothetical protein
VAACADGKIHVWEPDFGDFVRAVQRGEASFKFSNSGI